MSLAETLWHEVRAAAVQCLEHPFVQGLADGTLPRDRYRTFIAQDAFFLDVFARGYAHCALIAPDRDGQTAFRRLRDGVFDELRLHRAAAHDLQIDLEHVEPLRPTLAYTRFLEECTRSKAEVAITVASMTPCMRLYAWLGQQLASGAVAEPYRCWVETYASVEMEELAVTLEMLLDRYATPQGASESAKYRRAIALEYDFFDGAWKAGAGE